MLGHFAIVKQMVMTDTGSRGFFYRDFIVWTNLDEGTILVGGLFEPNGKPESCWPHWDKAVATH